MQNIAEPHQMVVCVGIQYSYDFFIFPIDLFTQCSQALVLKHRDVLFLHS